jgi:hypothetical protein
VPARAPATPSVTVPSISLTPRPDATVRASSGSVVDVRYYRVDRSGRSSAEEYPASWVGRAPGVITVTGSPGDRYCLSARARSPSTGLVSPWSSMACTQIPLDDRALVRRTTGWTSLTGSAFYASTAARTSRSGAVLRLSGISAHRIAVIVETCPSCGSIGVYAHGKLQHVVSTRSATTRYRVALQLPAWATDAGTVDFHSRSSARVIVDGVAITQA